MYRQGEGLGGHDKAPYAFVCCQAKTRDPCMSDTWAVTPACALPSEAAQAYRYVRCSSDGCVSVLRAGPPGSFGAGP
jgi:hypothetical protein